MSMRLGNSGSVAAAKSVAAAEPVDYINNIPWKGVETSVMIRYNSSFK